MSKGFAEYLGVVVAILLAIAFVVIYLLSGLIFGRGDTIDDFTYRGVELRTPGGAVPTHPPEVMTPTYAPPAPEGV